MTHSQPFSAASVEDADCPVCRAAGCHAYRMIDEFLYYECNNCNCIFVDPGVIEKIDQGTFVREYDQNYWADEMESSRRRSFGPALARVAELFLYSRRSIQKFLDIGAGGGYLLDALSVYLPASVDKFYGIEKYPPPVTTGHRNFFRGEIDDLTDKFDAGVCIEVIEHLTPTMVRKLAESLARRCEPGALFLFNTGLTNYVREEDPSYLDPVGRGHIMSYSVQAAAKLFGPSGFSVMPIPGKSWAFLAEYRSPLATDDDVCARIWSPIADNVNTLTDPTMGSLMYVLGLETARAYT